MTIHAKMTNQDLQPNLKILALLVKVSNIFYLEA
jgi:hypothetical protein